MPSLQDRTAARGLRLPRARTLRRALGFAITFGGFALLVLQAADRLLAGDPRLAAALEGGLIAALATALGTLPVLLAQRVPPRVGEALLGFGAGVMLAASSFSLVVPALGAARAQGASPLGASLEVGLGIALGAAFLLVMGRLGAPPEAEADERAQALRRAWLFVGAIALHNLPEGMAIGVAAAAAEPGQAQALATGIALQDVPEGLVVALVLLGAGYRRAVAAALGMASGLVEPLCAVLGAAAVSVSQLLLPWGLAFAAGAMLFAIGHEVIPGAHGRGRSAAATAGLLVGFVLMMVLDTAFA